MKSLASVTLTLLLLASVSFSSVYAQDAIAPKDAAKPVAEAKPKEDTEVPAVDGSGSDDMSIEDIIAGAANDEDTDADKSDEAKKSTEVKPEEAKKADTASQSVENGSAVKEPSGEVLETAKQAEDDKKAEEAKQAEEAPQKGGVSEKTDSKDEAASAETELKTNVDGMDVVEKMSAETKELETPGDSATAAPSDGESCIFSAGQPESVTVPEVCNYVDIHARRIAYKAEAEKLRASLEKRRVSFERPHFIALEKYRNDIENVYAEDSKKYHVGLGKEQEQEQEAVVPEKKILDIKPEDSSDVPEGMQDSEDKTVDKSPQVKPKAEEEETKLATPVKEKADDKPALVDKEDMPEKMGLKETETAKDVPATPLPKEDVGVTEKELPPELDDAGEIKKSKKVVIPADAPAFDPELVH